MQQSFTIAFVEGVTLGRWTRAWAQRLPGIRLEFVPTTAAGQLAALLAGDADVAFVRLPIADDGLSVIPLYEELAVVLVPRDHEASAIEELTLADLDDETHISAELPTADAAALVAAGGGVLVVPQSVARLHARKDIDIRPIADAPVTRIALAWHADRTTQEVEEFIGIVRGRTANSSRGGAAAPTQPPDQPKARPTPTERQSTQRQSTQRKATPRKPGQRKSATRSRRPRQGR